MKNSSRTSVVIVSTLALIFSFVGLNFAQAATAPTLGASAGYAVYGDAGITNSGAGTNIWGNVGDNGLGHSGLTVDQVGTGVIDNGVDVRAAALAAYGEMAAGGATASLDLAGTHTVSPGLYTVGASTLNGTLTLNGAGVYIFRSSSSISTSGAARVRLINGATACNVFWQIPISMTIGSGSEIVGTVIANSGAITLADSASLQGRAFSLITQVTMLNNQITEPTCSASANASTDIKVKKTASDYKLNSGPKKVTFTYKVTNESDAALTDISVKDDKCDDVNFVSGDSNDNNELDTNEEWKYTCKKTVKETETNEVTARGTANGERVKDTDTAKVVVSVPGLPNAGFAPVNDSLWGNILAFFSF